MIIYAVRTSIYSDPEEYFTTEAKADNFCKAQLDYYSTYMDGQYKSLGENYYYEEIEVK